MSYFDLAYGVTSKYFRNVSGKKRVTTKSARNLGKRAFDFSGALIILVCLLPLFVMVAALIAICHGRPVFYGHKRVGFMGREFRCLKFRTMVNDGDAALKALLERDPVARAEWAATRKLKNDPRTTVVGRVLRHSSIDEFPQLLNVLRGEMSLVGPRPIVSDEMSYYADHINVYFSVKPGMTGPWQVGGRSDVSYEARVEMDREYVATASLLRDVVILLRTVPAVLASRGSY